MFFFAVNRFLGLPPVVHPEPLFRSFTNEFFYGLSIEGRRNFDLFFAGSFQKGRIERLLKMEYVVFAVTNENYGPDKGLCPHGEQRRSHVHGGHLIKERQKFRFR